MSTAVLSRPFVMRKKPVNEAQAAAPQGAAARLQDVPLDQLDGDLKRFDELIGELRTLLKEARALKIDSLPIDGANKITRAKEVLDEFIGKAIIGFRTAKRERPQS